MRPNRETSSREGKEEKNRRGILTWRGSAVGRLPAAPQGACSGTGQQMKGESHQPSCPSSPSVMYTVPENPSVLQGLPHSATMDRTLKSVLVTLRD